MFTIIPVAMFQNTKINKKKVGVYYLLYICMWIHTY